jgi:hypothetical protein
MALPSGSPASGAIPSSSSLCTGLSENNVPRDGSTCDIGAYQSGTPALVPEGGAVTPAEVQGHQVLEKCSACAMSAMSLEPSAGDPVNSATGDLSLSSTDLSVPTFGPSLSFTRTYDASLAQAEEATSTPGPLGYGWTDNYDWAAVANSPSSGDVTIDEGTGASVVFQPVGSNGSCPVSGEVASTGYCAPPRVEASLAAASGGGYVLTQADGITRQFSSTQAVPNPPWTA